MKIEIGKVIGPVSVPKGWAYWVEDGVWYKCRAVSPKKFGRHAYDNGGYERGIIECPCGCWMGRYNSGGPVDPFGCCPKNPLTTHFEIGDLVVPSNREFVLACGSGTYPRAVVVSVKPFIMVSEEGDMLWQCVEKWKVQPTGEKASPKAFGTAFYRYLSDKNQKVK